ncbi:hypothetical protein [Luedemannella helvata]|uniref:Uncharacterized protein n=1 Tax=Luedemannella helvata TaxID=349315 RepID=A0ABP4XDD0_9ACTN
MGSQFPMPATDTDDRFTYGLVLDVAHVLALHGYPDAAEYYDGHGADLVAIHLALFRLLYAPSPARPATPARRTAPHPVEVTL